MLNDIFTADGSALTLVLQDRGAMAAFFDCLADADYRGKLGRRFGVIAADYALGMPFDGTDLLRRIGKGLYRMLISANAKRHLPRDYAECCEQRIDKSAIRITTLAQKLAQRSGLD